MFLRGGQKVYEKNYNSGAWVSKMYNCRTKCKKAVEELKLHASIEHIYTTQKNLLNLEAIITPAVVVDGKILVAGRVHQLLTNLNKCWQNKKFFNNR